MVLSEYDKDLFCSRIYKKGNEEFTTSVVYTAVCDTKGLPLASSSYIYSVILFYAEILLNHVYYVYIFHLWLKIFLTLSYKSR